MSGFAACVLAERFPAVHSTWCSSGPGTSLRCHRGRPTDKHMRLGVQLHAGSCSCPAPSPEAFWVQMLFLARAKPFLEEISQVVR